MRSWRSKPSTGSARGRATGVAGALGGAGGRGVGIGVVLGAGASWPGRGRRSRRALAGREGHGIAPGNLRPLGRARRFIALCGPAGLLRAGLVLEVHLALALHESTSLVAHASPRVS